jgi:hypothetical protein
MDQRVNQRGTSLSLYSVICPRCETVSPMDQPACPYCGADRHGAVMTKGAETAVRAVEAARAVLRHAYERGEIARAEPIRAYETDARLPVLARPLGLAMIVPEPPAPERRLHPAAIAGVLAGMALAVFAWIRSDLDRAAPRARLAAVSAAGEIGKVAEKAPPTRYFAMTLPTGAMTCCGVAPIAPFSGASSAKESPSPVKSVDLAEKPPAVKVDEVRRSISKPNSRIKHKDARIVVKTVSKRQKVAACSAKGTKVCAEHAPRHASAEKAPAKRQTVRSAQRNTPAARAKPDPSTFQRVIAPPKPVKPAMTSDDSWKPSRKVN